jgi:tetratricopeptide (TPR) repeat protein
MRFDNVFKFLGLIVVATVVVASGVWWLGPRSDPNPMVRGLDAYARGDWKAAAGLARQRLKSAGNDTSALRLLARASVRLGLDSPAMAVYQRLGPEKMAAEDLCLLGIALTRTGNARGGLAVWEQSRSAKPDHAETLWELTLAYAASDRLSEAAEAARRLAACPGWRSRAEGLQGAIQFDYADPAGAIAFWQQAREDHAAAHGAVSTPIVPPKEMARALLQAERPAEARLELNKILTVGPDPEGFWLLSRAFLQEGAKAEALAALEKAGSYRDEHTLVAGPAALVGSKRCAQCHSAIHQAQQGSRHARTFFRATELGDLELPARSFADPARSDVTHSLERVSGGTLQQKTHVDGRIFGAVVTYAFGSGDRGLTLVGRDDQGQSRELRLSRYSAGKSPHWNVTAGQTERPSEAGELLGRPLNDDGVRRCLLCHVTSPRAILDDSGPCASDRGIGCEKCHGPGGNHLRAIDLGFPDRAIINPAMASGMQVVKLCGQCHSPRGGEVVPEDPASVRFQGTTLTWSRCFTESQNQLDCMTCHDPHRNAVASAGHYEARCLHCHSASIQPKGRSDGARSTDALPGLAHTICPVNPARGCIACHMPAVKNVVAHSTFTDHNIRAHRDSAALSNAQK